MLTLRISIATLLLASSASAQRATRPATTDSWEVTELTNRPSLTLELPALNTVRAARAARAAAFEVRPSGKSAQIIRFNARGLERHMSQVDAACPPGGNGDGPAADQVYAEAAVDERAEIVSAPQLDYPPALWHAGLQGRVTVQAVIDTLGRAEPASLKVIARPNTAFDESARAYVLHAVFRPARVKGRAVRVLINVPVDYRIE